MSETRDLYTAEALPDEDLEDDDTAAVCGLYAEVSSTGYQKCAAVTDSQPTAEMELYCSTDAPETKGAKDTKDATAEEEPISEWERIQQVQYELQRVGHHLQNGLKVLQEQMDNKIPSPDRKGQPPLRDQISDLNKEIDKVAKKSSPYATTEEKIEITKDLQKCLMQVYRIQYGLAPGAKDDAIWNEVRKDEAKKIGLPSDATFDQINEAHERKQFEDDCKYYGIDPKKSTAKDLDAAVERRKFERECELYKLDPKKSTPELLEEAREQFQFEQDCKLVKLDPGKTTRDEARLAVERHWHELDCKQLGLDPKTTTKEDAMRTRAFNFDCYFYKIDKNDKDAPQKIHVAKCKDYELPPTATPSELQAKIEAKQKEREAKEKQRKR